jgi:hypothetical protein
MLCNRERYAREQDVGCSTLSYCAHPCCPPPNMVLSSRSTTTTVAQTKLRSQTLGIKHAIHLLLR